LNTRRSYLVLVSLIVLALVGVGLIALPQSPFYKKPVLGLDLQGGLEVVLEAVPPRGHQLTDEDIGSLKYFRFIPRLVKVAGVDVHLSRTGFGGELEIGELLDVSQQTIKNHVSTILHKLGVPNRVRAVTAKAAGANAQLKILEEPPPGVVFVFATTEPQKIANTAAPILSRRE
jgi:preprotein translocase subunit SecD